MLWPRPIQTPLFTSGGIVYKANTCWYLDRGRGQMLEKYRLYTQEYFQKRTQEDSKYRNDHKERVMVSKYICLHSGHFVLVISQAWHAQVWRQGNHGIFSIDKSSKNLAQIGVCHCQQWQEKLGGILAFSGWNLLWGSWWMLMLD